LNVCITLPANVAMDVFLEQVGTKINSSFVKLHVGTDDLDELLEFTWERSDLSPLVDAGVKPLLRNKLYRGILEERTARSKCVGAADDMSCNSSTGMPSSASVHDEGSEVVGSEVQNDDSSLSQTSEAPNAQVASLADASTNADSEKDSSASTLRMQMLGSAQASKHLAKAALLADTSTNMDPGSDSSAPRSSKTSMPTSSSKGFCTICGEYGHRISECKGNSSNGAADFPSLGIAGKRSVVPQAQVSVNQFDERQRRQVAQKAAAVAQESLKRDIQNKAAESRAAATAAAKENQFKCYYCQEKGHWLRDCPKKTADVKQAARQRAQARQGPQASQANGYGRQFGSSSQFSMSSAYQSTYRISPLSGCPRSCRICYPTG